MNDKKKKGKAVDLKPADMKIQAHLPAIKITASVRGKPKYKETFPSSVSSADIVTASTMATHVTLPLGQKQQLIETIDFAKTNKPFISKFKIAVSLKDGFQFEIERQPSKIVKTKKKT